VASAARVERLGRLAAPEPAAESIVMENRIG
jgi:hypothetical protein